MAVKHAHQIKEIRRLLFNMGIPTVLVGTDEEPVVWLLDDERQFRNRPVEALALTPDGKEWVFGWKASLLAVHEPAVRVAKELADCYYQALRRS